MSELEADIAITTETWFQDTNVDNTLIDAAGNFGLSLFARNRQSEAANGRQYGGVAILARARSTNFKPLTITNPDDFEVYCVVGKVSKIKEKVFVVACYIPPNYPSVRANACLDYISDAVAEAKRQVDSPMIIVGGDFNQWLIKPIIDEHSDLREVEHGPTRGDRKIDKFLVNFPRSITESDTLPPLDDGQGRESDHLVVFFKASFPVLKAKTVSYRYRHFTNQGAESFKAWIAEHNFEGVYTHENVNDQLDVFLGTLESKMDEFFPYKTTVRRVSDPPWINPYIKTLIKKRRRVYHKEGRSTKWKELMKKVRKLVKKRAGNYWDYQRRNLLQKDASRVFFKNVKAYSSRERPPIFDVRSIFPEGLSDAQVAERLAVHFNGISCEFDGLDPEAVPHTYSSPVQVLSRETVASRLVKIKKPKSMVKHDIFPALIKDSAYALAGPLTHIFNTITYTSTRPIKWKEAFVTPIPKKSVPETVNNLRNISCTALFSKVYESFVLGWLGEQVGMRANQLGGMKGAGTEHYLVELYQLILETLEDPRAASITTSIDYAKAFNRLDFLHCLNALATKGASSELLGIVASFLTSRTMSVKVGQVRSKPRIVLGGVPQGSILGVFLFNATTDSFEAGSKDVVGYKVIGGVNQPLGPHPTHDSSLDLQVPSEYDQPGFKAWESELLSVLKYIDDNILHEKLCFDGLVIDKNGQKRARAVRSQNLFRQITRLAELMGMKVNSSKTMVLCVSDSRTYEAAAYIEDADGNTIDSVNHLKILGMHFSNKPNMGAQVDSICAKFGARIWILRHLRHNWFNKEELLRVYKSIILPCHDYCSSVFHSSLTLSQTIILERLQAKALKAIFGYEPSYRQLMEKANLTTLRARRESRELAFALKCASSDRFRKWFPVHEPTRVTRGPVFYKETFARCSRCFNSPLFNMQRRLDKDMVGFRAREGGVEDVLQTART